jgi:hypothetical protein
MAALALPGSLAGVKGVVLGRREGHASPPAHAHYQQAPAADLRPADGDLRGRVARGSRRPRNHARHRRNACREFFRLLGDGRERGIERLSCAYQEGEGEIAEALSFAARFAADDCVSFVLADNIFERSFRSAAESFEQQETGHGSCSRESTTRGTCATLASRRLDGERLLRIIERPEEPPSQYESMDAYYEVNDFVRTHGANR